MSAAKEAKEELTKTPDSQCCKAALLSGVIHTAGTISVTRDGMRVLIETENPLLERVMKETIDCLFGDGETSAQIGSAEDPAVHGHRRDFEPAGETKQKLLGGPAHLHGRAIAISGEFVPEMLLGLRILKPRDGLRLVEGIDPYLIESDCCKRSYLAGAFLGGGALITTKGYHLEFTCTSKKLRDDIMRLLEEFEIKAAALDRKEKYVAYIKNRDAVSDCLAFMGASKSVLQLNLLVAERGMNREVNRAANCDLANLSRMVTASVKQQEAIKSLGVIAEAKLRETAEARLKHPDFSFEELAEVLGISKGAVKYRLERLVTMAEKKEG